MKKIKYYKAEQAQASLDRVNSKYAINNNGGKWRNNIAVEYDYYTVDYDDSVHHYFESDELKRMFDNGDSFEVINNPTCFKTFDFTNIFYNNVIIYGNQMTEAEVNAACQSYIDNFDSFPSGFKYLHIGYNGYDIEFANAKPSDAMIESLRNLVEVNGCKVVYFDGTENIEIV